MKVRSSGKTKIASVLASILVFVFTSGVAIAVIYDMPVYNPTNDASYEILAPNTWQEAESTAVSRGGHLTSIHSEAENNFILGMISFWSWLGLYQPPGSQEPDKGWVWSDATAVDYVNWDVINNEPNNYGGSENVAEMKPQFDPHLGQWNDRSSVGPLPGVAKYAGFRGGITNPANGHIYYLVGGGDWNQIESWAVGLFGGHLVTINDAAEQAWLESVFGTDTLYWIGMNDVNTEGSWEWVSGQPVTYTNWAAGEPNNYLGAEDYAVMNWDSGKWNDVTIGSPFITVGIVEVAPVPVYVIPKKLNVKENGVLPVVICSSEDFDVTTIDPESIMLEGVAPVLWNMGSKKLTLKFSAQEIVAAIGEVDDGDEVVLHLTGNLKEESGGGPITGEDTVLIIKKGKSDPPDPPKPPKAPKTPKK